MATLGIEEHQPPLGKVQQGANSDGHIHDKNVGLDTVVEQLEPRAVVTDIMTTLRSITRITVRKTAQSQTEWSNSRFYLCRIMHNKLIVSVHFLVE